ncbi:MAG: hypothetical protein A4E35_00700 [Methanoregula sp. PtaU1.Bin051]|nr:MAG: hypothetical protein A4E35_00700 [Methanoregula sp. PtaU1.Bin051]
MAIAPLIISASRSTDIPAFYGDWFASRLASGYAVWKNPFNGDPVYVSFARVRVFAFWSKNPSPFFPVLDEVERQGYGYFFLFTLNDYENEGLEPGIPPLEERITTFIRLAGRTPPGRMVWRFDPILLSDTLTVEDLVERIRFIGDRIHEFTRGLVISFVDITKYRRVQRNLAAAGCHGLRECTDEEVTALAEELSLLSTRWGIPITACGERRDLTDYGIARGQCIGYDLIASEFSHDSVLMQYFTTPHQKTPGDTGIRKEPSRYFKDPGQRGACGCIVSKDIGQYTTCPHGCRYCYANSSAVMASRNYQSYCSDAERGIFHASIL